MSKDNGGAAFPIPGEVLHTKDGGKIAHANPGMTLRDYFAANAMSALITSNKMLADTPSKEVKAGDYSRNAYAIADAMLAERSK
jgi:hypothetical protein